MRVLRLDEEDSGRVSMSASHAHIGKYLDYAFAVSSSMEHLSWSPVPVTKRADIVADDPIIEFV